MSTEQLSVNRRLSHLSHYAPHVSRMLLSTQGKISNSSTSEEAGQDSKGPVDAWDWEFPGKDCRWDFQRTLCAGRRDQTMPGKDGQDSDNPFNTRSMKQGNPPRGLHLVCWGLEVDRHCPILAAQTLPLEQCTGTDRSLALPLLPSPDSTSLPRAMYLLSPPVNQLSASTCPDVDTHISLYLT